MTYFQTSDKQHNFAHNFKWQRHYYDQIKKLLKKHASHLVDIEQATEEQDGKEATDFVFKVTSGKTIGVRLRRGEKPYRDFTIRARVPSGADTELHKLKKGYGDWYLYAWTDEQRNIEEYIFVDLNVLRTSGAFNEDYRLIQNYDGTAFIAIPITRIAEAGALMEYRLNPTLTRRIKKILGPKQLTIW